MNQAAAKAERRSIRKAFGPEAVELLQRQTEATNFCTATVSAQSERVEALVRTVDGLAPTVASHDRELGHLQRDHCEQNRLIDRLRPAMRETVWGRLRWLFTGQ